MIKWTVRQTEKHGLLIVLTLAFFLMAWDIGNLDALRQGTEGFYLQISKEMAQQNSFLTPLFRGEPHWSKPPLHFWLPFPLYYLAPLETTTAARLAVLIFSLFSIAACAKWVERFFAIPKLTAALFFLSTIGFAKYSRIYMMEMPLALLSTLGALYLFAAIVESKNRDWVLAALFCALSVLVKGPVSWVMIGISLFCFLFMRFRFHKKIPFKALFLFSIAVLFLGSLWFVACYIKYGQYFIDYFFLRENLGKFTSKSYPVRVVFQGLLIFSLPWSLYLPLLFNRTSWKLRLNSQDAQFWPRLFVIINSIVFFGLWLIPNQRSHHYSMPSIFFFLIILLDTMKCHYRPIRGWQANLSQLASAGLFFLLLPVLFLSFAFPSLFESASHAFIMTLAIILTIFAFLAFTRQLSLKTRALAALLCFGFTWSFVTPLFILPTVPERVIKTIADRDITVVYRKPYFIEEALERSAFSIISAQDITTKLERVPDLLFIPERVVSQYGLASKIIVLDRWRVWQKSRKMKHILAAINDNDLRQLQESLLLVQVKR